MKGREGKGAAEVGGLKESVNLSRDVDYPKGLHLKRAAENSRKQFSDPKVRNGSKKRFFFATACNSKWRNMITSDNFLLTSGVILTLLISATVISYTSKFIFMSDKLKKSTNLIYDPDLGLNYSSVCIFSERVHPTKYENSACFNKTLLHWYNPWLRHNLWSRFWSEIKTKSQLRPTEKSTTDTKNATEPPTPTSTVTTDDLEQKRKAEVLNAKEKPVEFVCSLLVGLLIASGAVACWEVCKDKLKRNDGAAIKAREQQCSLADFTINRHLRRESQQQTGSHLPRQASLELTAKVTQNLIHQSSLDRAFPKNTSEALTSFESRRNSVPANLVDTQQTTGLAKIGKRQSVDVSTEDLSSDSKRKFRHFIRRH